jgi:hypothetical protein
MSNQVSSSLLSSGLLDLPIQQRPSTLIMQQGSPKPRLATEKDLSITTKAEISHAPRNQNLANQSTAHVPAIDTIATASPDVAVYITFDTVGGAQVGKGKDSPVGQEGRAAKVFDLEGVAVVEEHEES